MQVSCLTFTMIVILPRKTIFEIVENFPAAKNWLDHCTKIMTLRAGDPH